MATTSRGCVFYGFGEAYALRLLVAAWSLRRVHDGPVTVFLAPDGAGRSLRAPLADLGCDVVFEADLTRSGSRHRLLQHSPYDTTLVFDGDLLFRSPIDELWEPLEREGLLVTRFFPPPHGVDGTPDRPGFADRLGQLEQVRGLVDGATWEAARRRLVDERIDVNVGVMGISRPRGDAFLADFAEHMGRARSRRIPLADEMVTLALLPRHRHHLADEIWNCPADECFRRTDLDDARVVHYFADGWQARGARLGRNPATPAGELWYAAQRQAAQRLDLARWEARDAGFTPTPAAQAAAGGRARTAGRGPRPRSLRRRIRRWVREGMGAGLGRVRHVAQQAALSLLARRGHRVGVDVPATATVIVLSYRRMGNIEAIVRSALMCGFVDRVVVSNNNPDVDLRPHLSARTMRDPRLVLVQQGERRGPSFRYDLAREHPAEHYICIDDDVFPTPWLLARSFTALVRDPSVPRGHGGEVFDPAKGRLVAARPRRRRRSDPERPVDVLVRTYLFTRAHLERYFELVRSLGLRNEEVRSSEDVILSAAGTGRPVRDEPGFLYSCPTWATPGVAVSREEDFVRFRHRLYLDLAAAR